MNPTTENIEYAEEQDEEALAPTATTSDEMPQPNPDEPTGIAAIEAELAEEVQEEAEEEDLLVAPIEWDGEIPAELIQVVDQRLDFWRKLLDIDEARRKLQKQANVPEMQSELSRQAREIKRAPTSDILKNNLGKIQKKLESPTVQNARPIPNPNSKRPPLNPSKLYEKALRMGGAQIVLLLKRAYMDDTIPVAARSAMAEEPFLLVCRNLGLNVEKLIGWAYYAMAVQRRLDEYRAREEDHRSRVAEARAEERGGIIGRLSGKGKGVPKLDPRLAKSIQAARRELQAIDPKLTDLFWSTYEDVAWLFCQGSLDEEEERTLRAFLRYGLLAVHPGLIAHDAYEYIMRDCAQDVYEWEESTQSLHVVYADEYLRAIVKQKTTVSPDEQLQLNGRGSDEWKADRVWRQAVISQIRDKLYRARFEELRRQIQEQQDAINAKQKEVEELKKTGKNRLQIPKLEQELTVMRPILGRLTRAAEHIESKVIPRNHDLGAEARGRLSEEMKVLTPEAVARREARFIRQMARLAARLKEPFPQFVLRDHFKPERGDQHSRQAVIEEIESLEQADVRVFHHTLMTHKHLDRRITVRMSPTFLIVPGRGQMGFAISPRKWDDNGRFALALLPHRQGILRTILTQLLSDFRWDCSKEEAGMDWLKADALCAAYATARWNVRKMTDKTQKSMGFDRKLKDKANWRVHYRLYIRSAAEQGRLLFVRCHEVYKIVVKYLGLPPGLEPLKRN